MEITRITKDGQEIDLSLLQNDSMFRLGMKAAKEGWGTEGGAFQKNGAKFRLGWWAVQNRETRLPYDYATVLNICMEKEK